jgi:hypothetical protein
MHHLYLIILLLSPITLNLTLISRTPLSHHPTPINLLTRILPQVIILNHLSEKQQDMLNLPNTFRIIIVTLSTIQFLIHLSLPLHHLLLVSTLYLLIYLITISLQLTKILFLIFLPSLNPHAMRRP